MFLLPFFLLHRQPYGNETIATYNSVSDIGRWWQGKSTTASCCWFCLSEL